MNVIGQTNAGITDPWAQAVSTGTILTEVEVKQVIPESTGTGKSSTGSYVKAIVNKDLPGLYQAISANNVMGTVGAFTEGLNPGSKSGVTPLAMSMDVFTEMNNRNLQAAGVNNGTPTANEAFFSPMRIFDGQYYRVVPFVNGPGAAALGWSQVNPGSDNYSLVRITQNVGAASIMPSSGANLLALASGSTSGRMLIIDPKPSQSSKQPGYLLACGLTALKGLTNKRYQAQNPNWEDDAQTFLTSLIDFGDVAGYGAIVTYATFAGQMVSTLTVDGIIAALSGTSPESAQMKRMVKLAGSVLSTGLTRISGLLGAASKALAVSNFGSSMVGTQGARQAAANELRQAALDRSRGFSIVNGEIVLEKSIKTRLTNTKSDEENGVGSKGFGASGFPALRKSNEQPSVPEMNANRANFYCPDDGTGHLMLQKHVGADGQQYFSCSLPSTTTNPSGAAARAFNIQYGSELFETMSKLYQRAADNWSGIGGAARIIQFQGVTYGIIGPDVNQQLLNQEKQAELQQQYGAHSGVNRMSLMAFSALQGTPFYSLLALREGQDVADQAVKNLALRYTVEDGMRPTTTGLKPQANSDGTITWIEGDIPTKRKQINYIDIGSPEAVQLMQDMNGQGLNVNPAIFLTSGESDMFDELIQFDSYNDLA